MLATDLLKQQHGHTAALMERAREEADARVRLRLLGKIAEDLTLHRTLEGRFFYPLLRDAGLETEEQRSLQEHEEVKTLIAQLLVLEQHDPAIGDTLDQLQDAVREHVHAEEQGLFPLVFTKVSRSDLERVGTEMEQAIDGLRAQELLKLAEHRESPKT